MIGWWAHPDDSGGDAVIESGRICFVYYRYVCIVITQSIQITNHPRKKANQTSLFRGSRNLKVPSTPIKWPTGNVPVPT
jgi:hypothetical protein